MPEHPNYQSSYDAVADEYVRRISDELRHKPLDRALLDRFANAVKDRGPVCDMGRGPGHVGERRFFFFPPEEMARGSSDGGLRDRGDY